MPKSRQPSARSIAAARALLPRSVWHIYEGVNRIMANVPWCDGGLAAGMMVKYNNDSQQIIQILLDFARRRRRGMRHNKKERMQSWTRNRLGRRLQRVGSNRGGNQNSSSDQVEGEAEVGSEERPRSHNPPTSNK